MIINEWNGMYLRERNAKEMNEIELSILIWMLKNKGIGIDANE